MIGTSDRSYWLAEACKTLLLLSDLQLISQKDKKTRKKFQCFGLPTRLIICANHGKFVTPLCHVNSIKPMCVCLPVARCATEGASTKSGMQDANRGEQ